MKAFIPLRLVRSTALGMGLLALSTVINSCTSGGGGLTDTGYGPFDSRGNYVEAWADNPSKWRRAFSKDSAMQGDDAALLAANDSPPSDVSPITASTSGQSTSVTNQKPTTSSGSGSKPRVAVTSSSGSKPKTSATVASKSGTSSKTVASKPTSTRILVKKGDTLSALAMRYGSSVSAIQRANGMRDTKLSIGRALVIPRRK
ncbi:MAG: LysM peptidoglycan-binding domain-containing protein [Akkermansiaceae bacterium]